MMLQTSYCEQDTGQVGIFIVVVVVTVVKTTVTTNIWKTAFFGSICGIWILHISLTIAVKEGIYWDRGFSDRHLPCPQLLVQQI